MERGKNLLEHVERVDHGRFEVSRTLETWRCWLIGKLRFRKSRRNSNPNSFVFSELRKRESDGQGVELEARKEGALKKAASTTSWESRDRAKTLRCPRGRPIKDSRHPSCCFWICICNTICVYEIRFAEDVDKDLARIPIYYRKQIMDAMERRLSHTPDTPTKNRKLLSNLVPPWEAVQPVWELRVGDYRVFYDVSTEEAAVYVRAVRKKPAGRKTEDIL